jgi:hypothetical protein
VWGLFCFIKPILPFFIGSGYAGLGKLIQNTEPAGPENQGWNMFRNIEIPIFPIKAFQDFNWPIDGGSEVEEAMEVERQALQALGIQL